MSIRTPRLRLLAQFAFAFAAVFAFASGAQGATLQLPNVDPFYAAPGNLSAVPNGGVIRSRALPSITVSGVKGPVRLWEVLYRTNDQQQLPVATAATILEPTDGKPDAARPLLSYQIPYDGLAPKCRPSYQVQIHPSSSGVAGAGPALAKGWAVVTADFEGPNDTWIAGDMEGQGVLDGVRAAEGFGGAGLPGASTPVALWGYSGGAHATAWASELKASYAPELNVKAVAAGGVPASMLGLFKSLNGSAFTGVAMAAMEGLRLAYPQTDFSQYITPKGEHALAKIRTQCLDDFVFSHPFEKISAYTTVPNILAVPAIQAIAAANTLGTRPPAAPIYLYHAVNDELVQFHQGMTLALEYCAMGVPVQFIRNRFTEHETESIAGAASAWRFIENRMAGATAPNNCGSWAPTITAQ